MDSEASSADATGDNLMSWNAENEAALIDMDVSARQTAEDDSSSAQGSDDVRNLPPALDTFEPGLPPRVYEVTELYSYGSLSFRVREDRGLLVVRKSL